MPIVHLLYWWYIRPHSVHFRKVASGHASEKTYGFSFKLKAVHIIYYGVYFKRCGVYSKK